MLLECESECVPGTHDVLHVAHGDAVLVLLHRVQDEEAEGAVELVGGGGWAEDALHG